MTKKKRKRKLKIRNILLLVVPILLVIAACICIPIIKERKLQEARHEVLAEKIEQRNSFLETVNAQSAGDVETEIFEKIRTMALSENAENYTDLDQWTEVDIPDEEFEKIEALTPETDGSRYLWVLENAQDIDDDYLLLLSKDDDRIGFVEQYFNMDQYLNPPAELTESLDSVPSLIQWDLRWGYMPYGDWRMAFAGCAPTSISMVASYLNQDPTITPYAVAQMAEANGDYVNGAGTAYTVFDHAAAEYNLSMQGVLVTEEAITQALNDGWVLIAHVVPGQFTTVGHFMVFTGVEDGKLLMNDPNSIKNSSKAWDFDEVLADTDIIWGFYKSDSE